MSPLKPVCEHLQSDDNNNNNYPAINVGAVILLPLLVAVGAAGKRYSGI